PCRARASRGHLLPKGEGPAHRVSLTWRRAVIDRPYNSQKTYFNPNWICRDGVVVCVIVPGLPTRRPLLSKMRRVVAFGGARLTWLKMLKNSLLNCSSWPSVIRKCLFTRKSTVESGGPITVFRPRFPKVPNSCGTNAHGSN